MKITVYRHEEYSKFLLTIENGANIREFILYDMSVFELGEFIKAITAEEKAHE